MRAASEDVVVELLKVKCCPVLYYGLESVSITKSQIHTLEFVLNAGADPGIYERGGRRGVGRSKIVGWTRMLSAVSYTHLTLPTKRIV